MAGVLSRALLCSPPAATAESWALDVYCAAVARAATACGTRRWPSGVQSGRSSSSTRGCRSRRRRRMATARSRS
eukprot:4084026-Prymnesium_polylepis.1